MEIKQRSEGNVTILELSANIEGVDDSRYFYSALAQVTSPVILNLAHVRSIDKEGVGMIFSGYNYFINERNGRIVLAELSSQIDPLVRDVFHRTLKTYKTEYDAVVDFFQQK